MVVWVYLLTLETADGLAQHSSQVTIAAAFSLGRVGRRPRKPAAQVLGSRRR